MRGMQQWFNRVAAIALVSLTQTGCIATAMVERTAAGEPVDRMYFSLTANGEAYQVHRSWGDGASADHHVDRSFSVSRKDLPPACGGRARFFVNDPEHELAISAWIAAAALTADRAPRPDDRQPPCSVLLAYGAFADSVPAGGVVQIHPGSSITLEPGHVHSFWAAGGDCLVGEVSTVNDDETDNYFLDMVSRFPDVEEDEPPYRLIVPDYAKL